MKGARADTLFLSYSASALSCCLRSLAHLVKLSCGLTASISRLRRITSRLSSGVLRAALAVEIGSLLYKTQSCLALAEKGNGGGRGAYQVVDCGSAETVDEVDREIEDKDDEE